MNKRYMFHGRLRRLHATTISIAFIVALHHDRHDAQHTDCPATAYRALMKMSRAHAKPTQAVAFHSLIDGHNTMRRSSIST